VAVAYILMCATICLYWILLLGGHVRREWTSSSQIYILLFILYTYTYLYIILIQTGVCVALKDIGRRHPLANLENSSKRREYTQIVWASPSVSHCLSLFLHLSQLVRAPAAITVPCVYAVCSIVRYIIISIIIMTAAARYVQMPSRCRNEPYKNSICIIIILLLSSTDVKVVQTAISCCSGSPFDRRQR